MLTLFRNLHHNLGFTLVEVGVVVVIIGILATISIPQFETAIERSNGSQARVSLELIFSAERAYRISTGTYINCNNTADCNTVLNLELNLANWDYRVFGANVNNFQSRATRSGGSAAYNGRWVDYNQDRVWAGNWPLRWW